MINIQHVTVNDRTELATFCMSFGVKFGLAQKTQWPSGLQQTVSATKKEPTALSWVCQMTEIQTYLLYPETFIEIEVELNKVQGRCRPRQINVEHKKDCAHFPIYSKEWIRTKISSKCIVQNPCTEKGTKWILVSEVKTCGRLNGKSGCVLIHNLSFCRLGICIDNLQYKNNLPVLTQYYGLPGLS